MLTRLPEVSTTTYLHRYLPCCNRHTPLSSTAVSDEMLMKNLGQMSKSLKQLEIDIKNVQNQKVSTEISDEDSFADVMSEFVTFVSRSKLLLHRSTCYWLSLHIFVCLQAREQWEICTQMHEKMQSLYKDLAKYYVFDVKKYTLDEFFGDVKAFKEKFYVCLLLS